MAEKNLLAVLHKKGDLRLEEREIPQPGPGEVLIRVKHVGICGTDLHLFETGVCADKEVTTPIAIGHESSGVISKLGEGVTSLKVGDKVAMDPVTGCMACADCKKGNYNLCPSVRCCGVPPRWGSMAKYFVYKAADCYKLPDHISTEEGALLEPLTIAIHSCRRGGVSLGSKVLVLGDGPIGIMTLLAAKASGATYVCVTGRHDERLKKAKDLGANFTINVGTKSPKEVADMAIKALNGKPQYSIDTIGAEDGIQAAIFATHSGGTVVLAGLRQYSVTLPILNAAYREVDLRGVAVNAHCYPIAVDMVATGQIDVKPLLTDKFKLEDVNKAFERARKKDCMKVMIECGD